MKESNPMKKEKFGFRHSKKTEVYFMSSKIVKGKVLLESISRDRIL